MDMSNSVKEPLSVHPVADCFPPLPEAELQALAADIQKNGLHNPVWTWRGQIVDGRARAQACELAGVPPRYQEWPGDDRAALVRFAVSQNLQRRHLTASQRTVLALSLEEEFSMVAKERMRAGGVARQQGQEKIPYPENEKGQARDQAAALVGRCQSALRQRRQNFTTGGAGPGGAYRARRVDHPRSPTRPGGAATS